MIVGDSWEQEAGDEVLDRLRFADRSIIVHGHEGSEPLKFYDMDEFVEIGILVNRPEACSRIISEALGLPSSIQLFNRS